MSSHLRLAVLTVLAVTITAGVASFAGASASDPLATWEVTLTPNWVSPRDGAESNYQNVWVYPKSPTTPHRSPDWCRCQARYMLLDPRVNDSDGRPGRDEWWFVIERNWPSSYDPNRHGDWGRLVNFHNVENDVGWDTGNGVSALALDWLAAPAPQFTLEYHDGGKPHYLPTPTRDTFHTYVVKFVAGRTDGTTPRVGGLTVWADGANTPAIDLQNINTLQRYNGVTQKWMQLWEGDYTRGLPQIATQSFVLTRIGGTLAEALADRPIATGDGSQGQFYTGTGINLGPPSARAITSRTADQALIPTNLGGTTSPPPPTTTTEPPTTTTTPPPTTTTEPPTTTTTPPPTTTTEPPTTTTTPPPTTTTNPERGNGKKKGKKSEIRLLSAAGPALLEWDGRLFHTALDFRTYLLGKGTDWNRFVATHPSVVSALRLPSVKLDGKTFFTQAALTRWLARSGLDYRSWAKKHPAAAAILAGQKGAGAAQVAAMPSRALSIVPVVTWDGIGFTKAAGLKDHLSAKKVEWNAFLTRHPSIAQKFGLG